MFRTSALADISIGLYYLPCLAGFIMVVGGMWLIWKEKIYIDRETKEPIEIELPIIGKLKTNIPALVLFVIGFVLCIYPMLKNPPPPELQLKGEVENDQDYPFEVYAAISAESVKNHRTFSLSVPPLSGNREEYKLLYVTGDNRVWEEPVPTKNQTGIISLRTKTIPRTQVIYEPAKVPEKPPGY
jgi:hypothetical protein